MREIQFIFLLFFFNTQLVNELVAQKKSEPFLVVDPQGHNAVVNQIVYSNLTNELISVSDDKTIRFWSIEDNILNRTFRIFSDPSGPEGMIYAADISRDGRYLAIAGYSDDNEVKIIDIQKKKIIEFLVRHKNVVTDVAFSPDGEWLASASADESVILWKKTTDDPLGFSFHKSLWQHQRRVNSIAFSPDSKKLVSVSDDETVRIWDLVKPDYPSIELKNHLGQVKKVATGTKSFLTGDNSGIVNAWSWDGSLIKQIVNFGAPVNVIEANETGDVAFVSANRQLLVNLNDVNAARSILGGDQSVTTAYFKGQNLYIGQGREGNILAFSFPKLDPLFALTGRGQSFKSIFIKDGQIGLSNDQSNRPDMLFDFQNVALSRDKTQMIGFKSAMLTDGSFTFVRPSEDQLVFGSSFAIKNIQNDGRVLSYTLLPGGKVAVGSDRTLKIYSPSGQLLKTLSGHNGQVLSMAANKDFLVTYGGDQQIKFWDTENFDLTYQLFITKDYQWIFWRPDGSYSASAGGERFLCWQINEKPEKLAEYFDVSRYNKLFLTQNLSEARQQSRDQSISTPLVSIMPDQPEIIWKSPEVYQITTKDRNFRLAAEVYSQNPVEKVKILVEGKALPDKRGVENKKLIEEIIPINSYKTTIQIFVSTGDARLISEKRVIINPDLEGKVGDARIVIAAEYKPDIYFLGIGVSKFQNPKFDLTYADADAIAIHDIYAAKNSPVYDEFHGKLVLNENATKANILSEISSLAEKVKAKDMLVLFIASHGINEKGLYYVLTHDAVDGNLAKTCVNWSELADVFSKFPCKILLFLDTCHSGALGANLASNQNYIKNTEALRQMGAPEVGVVIMSGSTGDESALESEEWAHGVFTLSLIQGIKEGKADIKSDGMIELRELDLFVSENVYNLTNGKQNPTTQKPSTISKLIIY